MSHNLLQITYVKRIEGKNYQEQIENNLQAFLFPIFLVLTTKCPIRRNLSYTSINQIQVKIINKTFGSNTFPKKVFSHGLHISSQH